MAPSEPSCNCCGGYYFLSLVFSGMASLVYSLEWFDDLETRGDFMIIMGITAAIIGAIVWWQIWSEESLKESTKPIIFVSVMSDAWFDINIGIILLDISNDDYDLNALVIFGSWLGVINILLEPMKYCCCFNRDFLNVFIVIHMLLVIITQILFMVAIGSMNINITDDMFMYIGSVVIMLMAPCAIYEVFTRKDVVDDDNYGDISMHTRNKSDWDEF